MATRKSSDPEVLAAVDLGSNSFHMVVARFVHGQVTVIDRLREMVRLASGLDSQGRLSDASQAVAIACLQRFGERLREMRAEKVRAVGTNTLRQARPISRFMRRAASALGHPVEIIAGIEEARLIYLGASQYLPSSEGTRLILDIGGGSTEVIAGRGFEPAAMESLAIGCVGLSEACFPGGKLSAKNFGRARLQARLEFEPVRARFSQAASSQIAGTSGTIRAAHAVLTALDRAPHGITVEGLEFLISSMIAAGSIAGLKLPELPPERAQVLPGGVAILIEAMLALDLGQMVVADGALREGILYDLVGRLTDEDARVRTVRAMGTRYQVDTEQASRVRATALRLLELVRSDWQLDSAADADLLGWAASLHELGIDIAHAHYHRHGAYVLENADMPGFPRQEQQVLARIVLGHRRSFSRESFAELPREWRRRAFRLTLLLRLAVLFHRSRSGGASPPVKLRVSGSSIRLQIPGAWLDGNPLTLADLKREQGFLEGADVELTIQRRG